MRELQLSQDQLLASQRHDLKAVVYLLSGTLPGRASGVSDLIFRWSTLTFSGALGEYEAYIQKPRGIQRGQQFLPGDGSSNQPAHIPLRNLPLGDSPSVLAAIDDGKYAWENSTASLRVGYLKPGQSAADLAADDWTFLIKEGFLGAPQDVNVDGMILPVFNRGAKRNQVFSVPLLPTAEVVGANDKSWLGKPIPMIIGKPSGWFRVPGVDLGVRGFLVSGYAAGTTTISFQLITDGQDRLNRTVVPSDPLFTNNSGRINAGAALSGNVLMIHRRLPLYQIKGAETVFSQASGTVTVTLESGLLVKVPRGGFVQEHKSFAYGSDEGGPGGSLWRDREYRWIVCGAHGLNTQPGDSGPPDTWGDDLKGNLGWLLPDGSIKQAAIDDYGWVVQIRSESSRSPMRFITTLAMVQVDENAIFDDPRIPTYFDPDTAGDVSVSDQPQFTSIERADSLDNYPTGGFGANNALARDGSTNTGASLSLGAVITLSFDSAPSPFANGDTTTSTLHVVTQGNIDFKNSSNSILFGQATGTGGTSTEFRFTQSTARNFNEEIRCTGAGGSGGTVLEVWWTHSLSKIVTNTRTQDVTLDTSGDPLGLGEVMEFAELVMRVPSTKGNVAGSMFDSLASGFVDTTWQVEDTVDQNSEVGNASGNTVDVVHNVYIKAYPTAVMATLQAWFLGPVEGAPGLINSGAYELAQQRYATDDFRLNFYLTGNEFRTWDELERAVAEQSRAHIYYGPSGHEIVSMENASGATASGTVREFRLPGTPGANTVQRGPLLERTSLTEIVNTVQSRFDRDNLDGTLRSEIRVTAQDSVDLFGERQDPRWAAGLNLWMHSSYEEHPTFLVSGVVSGLINFYADRGKFAATRFSFDCSFPTHGVERGSPVCVVYEVAPNAFLASDRYRNVVCEVEEIKNSPIAGELHSIVCRAVELPTLGLPAFTWLDIFTIESSVWTDNVDQGNTWDNLWGVP